MDENIKYLLHNEESGNRFNNGKFNILAVATQKNVQCIKSCVKRQRNTYPLLLQNVNFNEMTTDFKGAAAAGGQWAWQQV